jgi:hypothetical protein
MTDTTLEVLNRRAAVAAVHAAASQVGADGEKLLDSAGFYRRVTALDPDTPGYQRQVQELVTAAAARHGQPAQQPAAPPEPDPGPRQWTMADVDASSPSELVEAMEAGLLVDLGYNPSRRRGHRR